MVTCPDKCKVLGLILFKINMLIPFVCVGILIWFVYRPILQDDYMTINEYFPKIKVDYTPLISPVI